MSDSEHRFDKLETRVDQLAERLDQVAANMDERFAHVDQRFEQVDQRFEHMDEKMDRRHEQALEHDLKLQEQRLQEDKKRYQDFTAEIFSRLDAMFAEQKRHLDIRFEAIHSDIRAFREEQKGHKDLLDHHDRDIHVLQGSHHDLNARVTRLERPKRPH